MLPFSTGLRNAGMLPQHYTVSENRITRLVIAFDLYYSTNITRVTKSRKRWVGYATRMGKVRNAHTILV